MTLINNDGITKEPRSKSVVDITEQKAVVVRYRGRSTVRQVSDIKNGRPCRLENRADVTLSIPGGESGILEFALGNRR